MGSGATSPRKGRHLSLLRSLFFSLLSLLFPLLAPPAGGRTLWTAVERALDELDRGLSQVMGDASPDRGRVAVGFLHTLGPVVVPRILREFRALHPGIRFDLVQDGHDVLLARLRDGTADICLSSPLPDDPAFDAHPLQEQRLAVCVPSGHPPASSRPGSVSLYCPRNPTGRWPAPSRSPSPRRPPARSA